MRNERHANGPGHCTRPSPRIPRNTLFRSGGQRGAGEWAAKNARRNVQRDGRSEEKSVAARGDVDTTTPKSQRLQQNARDGVGRRAEGGGQPRCRALP